MTLTPEERAGLRTKQARKTIDLLVDGLCEGHPLDEWPSIKAEVDAAYAELDAADQRIASLEARIGELEGLHAPLPEQPACQRCGRRDGLDCVLPNQLWNLIEAETGNGFLCTWCIDQEVHKRGLNVRAILAFGGLAISAGTNPENNDRHWEEHEGRLNSRVYNAEADNVRLRERIEVLEEVIAAAQWFVDCSSPSSRKSPYIQENGRHGSKSPWGELVDALAALHLDAPDGAQGGLEGGPRDGRPVADARATDDQQHDPA